MKKTALVLALAAGVLLGMAAGAAEKEACLPGGPLAGLVLPLYRSQHGEIQGHATEWELYSGSVEHWLGYWGKYTPQRSLYDRQTLLKNMPAKDIPGVEPRRIETYAEPVYRVSRGGSGTRTGMVNAPVPVVRCKAGDPVFRLDLGTLKHGLYAVRVIAAVETAQLERHRKPIYLRMTVNDRPDGGTNAYRIRIGYVDEFYSVAEFHFHAPVDRPYAATLGVDSNSLADLLVHNITLDDALAGFVRRPIKTRSTLVANPVPPAKPGPSTPARLARDADLWENAPPINAQWGVVYGLNSEGTWSTDNPEENRPNLGANGEPASEIERQYGAWTTVLDGPVLMKNTKLGLTYTIADLKAGRALPDPYPVKDDGAGVYTPVLKAGRPVPVPQTGDLDELLKADAKPKGGGLDMPDGLVPVLAGTPRGVAQNWFPVADAVRDRVWAVGYNTFDFAGSVPEDALRDAAVKLIRFAYDFPSMCYSHAMSSVVIQPGAYGRDLRCRQRDFRAGFHAGLGSVEPYDRLFPYIQGNEELARSIGRFVPWVKTAQDLIELLDVYLVQMQAKQILRYRYYSSNAPDLIVDPATVLADRTVTDPWMEWLFSRVFMYPLPLSGLQDLMVTLTDRDGIGMIGSHFYARGEANFQKAVRLDAYVAAGGNPLYNLSDRQRYPSVVESCYWPFRTSMAGLYFCRIGDVTGPEKPYGAHFGTFEAASRAGWMWTKDPAFAYVLKHVAGRAGETDAEWAAIEAAAAVQKRAPWLAQTSRMLPNWFGLLETGIAHDDPRFRRSVMIRVGRGIGHGHDDALDLQVHAHGYPMTMDGGQRSGYSTPDDTSRLVHNVAVADGVGGTHAWIAALSDAPAARCMAAQIETGKADKLHRRQVMLVDVDEGKGSRPLTPAELKPDAALDKNVVTPNSYVFDVVRIAGGRNATYQFHATVDDHLFVDFEGRGGPLEIEAPPPAPSSAPLDAPPAVEPVAAWLDEKPDGKPEKRQAFASLAPAEKKFLSAFSDTKTAFGGDAPDTVIATWRFTRGGHGSEQNLMPAAYNPVSPRKFMRLRVFGQQGSRVLSARSVCHYLGYTFGNVYVRRAEAETETVFPALIEPYVGEPFVQEARLLAVESNETDACRAVALELKTVNGHTDLCFADGRPERERRIPGSGFGVQAGASDIRIAGEFAYLSRDAEGLRAAMISGGTRLAAPGLAVTPATAAYTGRVTAVSYPDKTMTLDREWPAAIAASGAPVLIESGVPGHRTAYMIQGLKSSPAGSILTTRGGADFYLSRVRAVEAGTNRVHCALDMPVSARGNFRRWAASNEEMTRFWRADYVGNKGVENGFAFDLSPLDGSAPRPDVPVVAESDFGKTKGFRLWEYGVADEVRCATWVSLRRTAPGRFTVEGNVDVTITMDGKTRILTVAELARDGGVVVESAR